MDKSDFVIVGGVAAGPKTAATLARRLPGSKIALFQKEKDLSYATCGMPFFASGDVNSFEELVKTQYGVTRDADFFRQAKGFEAVTETEVVSINRGRKTVTVKRLDTGATFEHGYDKLILATGAEPNRPPFEVAQSDVVRPFTRPADAIAFRKLAQTGQVEKAVIVGSGFIGCELAEAVTDMWGIEATVVEKEDQVLPYVLDPEMAALVRHEMITKGITVHTGAAVNRVDLNDDAQPVVHIEGHDPITTDFVFLCMGVHPQTDLAREAGLELGSHGGIVVDETMVTSDPDIYAGGDCVESVNQITGAEMYIPMGSLANRHGRVIAENLAGNSIPFPGPLGAFVVRVLELNVGTVGLSQRAAELAGIKVGTAYGSFADKPDYFPESKTFTLKMVFEEETGKLLGLQAVGQGDVCRRVDVFSSMLQHGGNLDDLLDFEHCYAPPYSEALDPLHHLAGVAIARKRGMKFVAPREVFEADANTIFLDVREPEEVEGRPFELSGPDEAKNLISIPLNRLKDRISELDSGKKVVIVCKRGPRSYQAALILKANGFSDVETLGGGLQALP